MHFKPQCFALAVSLTADMAFGDDAIDINGCSWSFFFFLLNINRLHLGSLN